MASWLLVPLKYLGGILFNLFFEKIAFTIKKYLEQRALDRARLETDRVNLAKRDELIKNGASDVEIAKATEDLLNGRNP